MTEATETKRQSGQVRDGKWLVLTESTGEPSVNYVHDCGTEILGKSVSYPIWDGPTPLSGSGRCESKTIPYCPKCEKEPGSLGEPITPKGSYHNP